jgi:hypothetical protein
MIVFEEFQKLETLLVSIFKYFPLQNSSFTSLINALSK